MMHRPSTIAVIAAALSLGSACISGSRAQEATLLPRNELMVVNVDGSGSKILFSDEKQTFGSPDWSPDGKWIAYDTWMAGEGFADAQIEIVRADGTDRRHIGAGAMPSWSPDGKQLVCHTYDSPQSIVVMNIDGSGREVLMLHWGSPRWSPRGNRIISAMSTGGLAIFDLATGEEFVTLPNQQLYQGLSISPDGKRVCFTDSGQSGLALAMLSDDAKQATMRWLLTTGSGFSHSSWAPDGRRIVFDWRKDKRGPSQLFVLDVDKDQPPRKLKGQDPERTNANPDWSPDGKQIVFASLLTPNIPSAELP
jgi:TolB protein